MTTKTIKTLRLIWSVIASVFVLASGIFVPFLDAAPFTDISIKVTVINDIIPPGAITNLTAGSGVTEGSINLNWSAPHENGTTGGHAASYIIKYGTFSVNSLAGNTTLWWNNPNTITALNGGSPAGPGENETLILGGLAPGVTCYFAIKSRDSSNNISLIDSKTSSLNQSNAVVKRIPPAAITDLEVVIGDGNGEVDLSWTAPGDDNWTGMAYRYIIKYATFNITQNNFDGVPAFKERSVTVAGLNPDNDTLTGLYNGKTYYFAIKTIDDAQGVSGISNVCNIMVGDTTPPGPPAGLYASGNNLSVDLQWSGNTENDLAGYNIYCSTYSLGYSTIPVNASLITAVNYRHSGLTNGITYYFVITAVDVTGNESNRSGEAHAIPVDNVKPKQPLGVKGELVSNNETIRISWSGVASNEDETPCEDLKGYNIYRASYIDGDYVFKGFVSKDSSLTWFDPENIRTKVYYYKVRAEDTSGNESEESIIVNSSQNLEVIFMNETLPHTWINLPKDINGVMLKENNEFGSDLWIRISEVEEEEDPSIIKVYNFEMISGLGWVIDNFSFEQPLADITLSYEVDNGLVKQPMSISEDEAADNLAIFWFNGIEWIKIGGEVDELNHTLSVKSKKLGKYAIIISKRSTSFAIESIQPDKIFTPNGDGWNDYIEIQYTNPYRSYVIAKIYNIKGVCVADMNNDDTNEVLSWNGNDKNNSLVPGGVYIYQITVTGEENIVLNGTVVVAR